MLEIWEFSDKVVCKDSTTGDIKEFPADVDLKKALKWLTFINQYRSSPDGAPIHQTAQLGDLSLWSTVQFGLFEDLKALTKFQTFFAWIAEQKKILNAEFRGSVVLEECLRAYAVNLNGSGRIGELNFKNALAKYSSYLYHKVCLCLWICRSLVRPRPILTYTPEILDPNLGCDFRFSKAFQLLRKNNASFSEMFHTTIKLHRSFFGRIRFRKLAWSIEATYDFFLPKAPTALKASLTIDCPGGADEVLLKWWDTARGRYARHIVYYRNCIRRIENALRWGQVKFFLAMDDLRTIQPILIACHRLGVKIVLIQHGLLTRFHVGLACPGIPENALPTIHRFLVHAPLWQKFLQEYAPNLALNSTVVAGWTDELNIKLDSPRMLVADPAQLRVLLLYETQWPTLESIKDFVALLGKWGVRIGFKIRPDVPTGTQVEKYFSGLNVHPHDIVGRLDKESLASYDFVVGSHSSVMYHLAGIGFPVVRVMTSYDFGDQLVTYGMATPWYKTDTLAELINRIQNSQSCVTRSRALMLPDPTTPEWSDVLAKAVPGLTQGNGPAIKGK